MTDANRMTNPVDISPEAVEEMAEWCESGGRRRTVLPSQMLRALRSALTAMDNEISAAIGTNAYLDLPDGGSPSLAEQVRRMAKDAARYHWLVEHASPNQWRYLALILPDAVNETIDAAIRDKESK